MTILDGVNSPEDIKNLNFGQLEQLAKEIRQFLIEKVSKTGGHLASNLGVVELTLALHKAFNIPEDKVIFDVGHQAYVHKIITGRKDQFDTLRQYNGLSGFTRASESKYDIFSAGHSSTSISAALGMAKTRDINGENYSVVAVIGDGALTGGMALEALNYAGTSNTNFIVILNDNEMSISKNVGGMAVYLSKRRTDPRYLKFKKTMKKLSNKIPGGNGIYKAAGKIKDGIKYLMVQGVLFEELGFKYLGPIDGHNIEKMVEVFSRAKNVNGPVLIHVVTKKGKGYSFAEKNPIEFHGIGPFNIETGKPLNPPSITYSKVFGEEIVNAAKTNNKLIAITAAMPDGTGLREFSKLYPERFFDVGIAEQNAVTFAAGMAANGFKPVFAVYSTFLQRGYDQIVHDVCLQNLPVMFAVDRAGIVGEDGETHQGILDISYLRSMPNMTIAAPKDLQEFRMLLKWGFKFNSPLAIRYPRGGDLDIKFENYDEIIYKKWEKILSGSNCAILACGKMVQFAYMACLKLKKKNINCELVNCRFIKPLDEDMLKDLFNRFKFIFTVEDNYIAGGFGSSVLEYASQIGYSGRIINMGYPDEFITQGKCSILYKQYGLDSEGIMDKIIQNIIV